MTDPKKPVHLSLAALETGIAATVTIAARWPILMQAMHRPSHASLAETRLMVDEKFAAIIESVFAVQMSGLAFAGRMARGEVRHPSDVIKAATETLNAVVKPTRRRVVANAKRLTGW